MQNKNKTLAISIALILVVSMATSIMLVPNADAHTPAWQIFPHTHTLMLAQTQ